MLRLCHGLAWYCSTTRNGPLNPTNHKRDLKWMKFMRTTVHVSRVCHTSILCHVVWGMELLSASLLDQALLRLVSVSKLRHSSQLIPFHPKVQHWSIVLLPFLPDQRRSSLQYHIHLNTYLCPPKPVGCLLYVLLCLAEVDNLNCSAGHSPDTFNNCLKQPSSTSLIHFYKRCVSQPCLVQAAFLQDQRGST